MEKLKIGDKLCLVKGARFGSGTYYTFAIVERLTKTQAILSNGTRLINEPKKEYNKDSFVFGEYGDSWTTWQHETSELKEEARIESVRQKKNRWFSSRKFTESEQHAIYDLFESLGTLEPSTAN